MASSITANTVVYSDLDLLFLPQARNRDVSRLTNVDAVKRSVRNLLETLPGERPFQPQIGCNLTRYLFEPNDSVTERLLVEEIRRVIAAYEPRATLKSVAVTSPDASTLQCAITFIVLPQTTTATLNITLSANLLARIR